MRQPSKPSPKLAWRVARRVREALDLAQHKREQRSDIDHHAMSSLVTRWQKITRQMNHARRREWHAALHTLTAELQYVLRNIQLDLNAARRAVDIRDDFLLASMPDLLEDLKQLEDEFGAWRFDGKTGVLSVTTEPISLDEIELGPFAIHLTLSRISRTERQRVYAIEAVEPNPAEGSSHVTHPHVSDENLCEGDASAAIKNALEQGRLADFFMLVRSVLTTYNSGSPYVSLDRWHGGSSCHDCGNHVNDDDRCCCHRCDDEFCPNCTSCCEGCQNYFCSECMVTCPCCDESYCQGCMGVCTSCRASTCEGCLREETCTTCRERNQDEFNDESDSSPESSTSTQEGGEENGDCEDDRLPSTQEEGLEPGATLLPVRLGEAAGLP